MSDEFEYVRGGLDELFSLPIESTIEKAKGGDTEAARKILKWFCGAIKANTDKDGKLHKSPSGIGIQIDERILLYLGECFNKILDDAPGIRTDANHALGIVEAGKKGNKKTRASRERELDIGYQVMDCHEKKKAEKQQSKEPRLLGDSSPLEKAINEVASIHKKSYQTVKDAYDELNKTKKQAVEEIRNMGK